MSCIGYPTYGEPRIWCTGHGQWHYITDVTAAMELFFDALSVPDDGYYDRQSGVVDMQASDIVAALLAAGWRVPEND